MRSEFARLGAGTDRDAARRALQRIGGTFYDRGWALATGGNYSIVLQHEPLRLLVTASGRDKQCLADDDFVEVDAASQPVGAQISEPSAETALHAVVASRPGVGAVLHTHSVAATLLSDACYPAGELVISGYEMLKALRGVTTHATRVRLAIFDNTQDIPGLAVALRERFARDDPALTHGFLMRGHGLYTWGQNVVEARRHVEALEFLMEVLVRRGTGERPAPGDPSLMG